MHAHRHFVPDVLGAFRLNNQGGAVAKWQGKGLQNPHRRFDSAPRLQTFRRTELSSVPRQALLPEILDQHGLILLAAGLVEGHSAAVGRGTEPERNSIEDRDRGRPVLGEVVETENGLMAE